MTIKITFSCVDSDYLGVFFKGETGVVYSNQTGGTACAQPQIEGFFVLLNGGAPEDEQDPFHDEWPHEYRKGDPERVEKLLRVLGYEKVFEAPSLSELAAEEIGEAWIPVKVKEDATGFNADPVEGLRGRVGILTYPNSD